MWWCTQLDVFTYSTKIGQLNFAILRSERRLTKREVLRTLMSVFDPSGFLAAFLVNIKILLQEIWRSPISWDDAMTDEQNERWLQWISVLPDVNRIRIPRCYTSNLKPEDMKTTQLHIFVDASENAFGSVAYRHSRPLRPKRRQNYGGSSTAHLDPSPGIASGHTRSAIRKYYRQASRISH